MTDDLPLIDGHAVRARRMCAGLSQRELADKARAAGQPLSDSNLSKIERGLIRVGRPKTLVAIAAALGVDPNVLLQTPLPAPAGQGGDRE